MSLFGGASAANTSASPAATPTQGDLSKDVAIRDMPEDSVSDIKFSPQSDHLAVSSWDKKVRIYEIAGSGDSQGKAAFEFEGPVLCCGWSKDGTKVFGGGADKAVRMLDIGSGNLTNATQVAAHDQPVRCLRLTELNGTAVLVTGSWDKTVKYWDLRQQQPAVTLNCQDRVYAMDLRDSLLVIGTADKHVNIVNLNTPDKFYKTINSPLKFQTRVLSCFTDATGFAVGSVEGRCAIQYIEEKDAASNFSFKCHRSTPKTSRDANDVYSVNDISFHPQHGTFSTAGSDGTFHFWDKDAKHRLKGYPEVGQTISATDFSRQGNIFAYAASYDWSQGYSKHTPQSVNKIMLHPIVGEECKPRGKTNKR